MTKYTNVLLDYEGGIEILFSRPPGTTFSYSNDVIEYVRRRDVKTVPHVSSAGVREISFQMETAASPTMERQLDYFRRSGKSLLLFLPLSNFASEIVIKDVDLVEQARTTQTFNISIYCFGVEGMSALANDPLCDGEPVGADSDAMGEYSAVLGEIWGLRGFFVNADLFNMPAGNYTVYVRAVATTVVSNDLRIALHDPTAAEMVIDSLKTCGTTAYTWYAASGTIDSANADHNVRVCAQKATATTNSIHVDMVAYVHASGLITI